MNRSLPALLAALVLLFSPLAVQAQAGDPAGHLAALKAEVAAGKQVFVARQLNLTSAEESSFWPHYDEHQKALADLVQRRRENAAAYARAAAGATIDEDDADDIAEEAIEIDAEEAKLMERTYGRLSRVIPPAKALKYLQIELQLSMLLRYELAVSYPLGN